MTTRECSPQAGASRPRAPWRQAGLVLLLVLPWCWPFTPGPSPNVAPLLVAWACLAATGALLAAAPAGALPLHRLLPLSWIAAGLLNAAIALAQWFGIAPDLPVVSAADLGEAYGNLRQRNQFASLTSLALAALVFGPWRRVPLRALLPALLVLACANAATGSRTGLLQWVLLTGAAALWSGPRRWRLAACTTALVSYVAAALALPALLQHWHGLEGLNALSRAVLDLGCSSRRVLWSNVLDLIALRPWTGWGAGGLDYAHFVTLYDGARFCDILDNAHNLPLHVAVEFGVPAALVLTTAGVWLVWRAAPWREAQPARQLAWAGLAVIGVHSLVEYPLWYGAFQLAALYCLALLAPWRLQRPLPAVAAGSVAALLLVALAWVWSVYDRVSQAYRPPEQRRASARLDPVQAAGNPPLFRDQLRFAELSTTAVNRANAARVNELARGLLHYSPEPLVVEKVIESALLLGREDEALWHAARYKAAFPDRYAAWIAGPAAGARPESSPESR
jgi:O-antigen polymerase